MESEKEPEENVVETLEKVPPSPSPSPPLESERASPSASSASSSSSAAASEIGSGSDDDISDFIEIPDEDMKLGLLYAELDKAKSRDPSLAPFVQFLKNPTSADMRALLTKSIVDPKWGGLMHGFRQVRNTLQWGSYVADAEKLKEFAVKLSNYNASKKINKVAIFNGYIHSALGPYSNDITKTQFGVLCGNLLSVIAETTPGKEDEVTNFEKSKRLYAHFVADLNYEETEKSQSRAKKS